MHVSPPPAERCFDARRRERSTGNDNGGDRQCGSVPGEELLFELFGVDWSGVGEFDGVLVAPLALHSAALTAPLLQFGLLSLPYCPFWSGVAVPGLVVLGVLLGEVVVSGFAVEPGVALGFDGWLVLVSGELVEPLGVELICASAGAAAMRAALSAKMEILFIRFILACWVRSAPRWTTPAWTARCKCETLP